MGLIFDGWEVSSGVNPREFGVRDCEFPVFEVRSDVLELRVRDSKIHREKPILEDGRMISSDLPKY